MTRIILIISALFFCAITCQSNTIDSLIEIIPALSQEDKVDALNKLGKAFFQKGEDKKALEHFQQASEIALRTGYAKGNLDAYKGIIRAAFKGQAVEISMEYALKLEKLAEQQQESEYLAFAYSYIAQIKGAIMKDTESARLYLSKAIQIYESTDNQQVLPTLYNNLGIIYRRTKEYEKAIEQYQKGLSIAEASNDLPQVRQLKSNLASAYIDIESYDDALKHSLEALNISSEDDRQEVVAFDNLLIGKIYYRLNEYPKAIEYAKMGLKVAEAIQDAERILLAYELLMGIYKAQDDFKNAMIIAEKRIISQDSLNQAAIIGKLAEKEAEIALLQRDQKVLSLEQDAERQRLIRNGIIIIAIIGLILFLLLYKRKRLLVELHEQKLAELNYSKQIEEKEKKILKEKLSYHERALASKTMHIIQKNEILTELKNSISALVTESNTPIQPKINLLNRTIEKNINFDEDWKKFKLHFDEVHPEFFERLKQSYPALSNNDIRFCSYMKMGLSTKEIAQLMGVNATSIQKARYRLKKKMELEKSIDLIEFINNNI